MKKLLLFFLLSTTCIAEQQTPWISGDKLDVEIFTTEFQGHRYVLFLSHYQPEASSWVHDAECPKCSKEKKKIRRYGK